MEAKKHKVISEVGEGVLKEVLERGNPGRPLRREAFYLGNWITDVSQSVDPIAYKRAAEHVKLPDIDAIFEKFIFEAPSWIKGPIESSDTLNQLRHKLRKAEKRLENYVKSTLNAGKDGDLGKAFKEVFRFIGYFKFVAPKGSGVPPRMDPDSYLKVYDKMYQQYFPHEHLDRPEVTRDHYADTVKTGPRNHSIAPADMSQGDLYDYLRDNIQIAASRFASLDAGLDPGRGVSWAEGTFNPDRKTFTDETGAQCPIDDTKPSWNYHLALLGQALHAVEDFYAHSTFAEHASIALPADYKPAQVREDKEILLRRLKTWSFGCDDKLWTSLPDDMNVVTGYFDTHDFIVSLSHLLEEQLGWGRERLGQRRDDLEETYKKWLRDSLEFMSDPKHVLKRSNPTAPNYEEHEANEVGKWLWKKYDDKIGKNIDKIKDGDEETFQYVETIIDDPDSPFAGLPPEIKESFRKAVRMFGVYKSLKHLYKTFKEMIEFFEGPWAWLSKIIGKEILDQVVEQVRAYVLQAFDKKVGSLRIGCHSLLSKDTGTELYYVAGMACAESVHWYIVNTLARHGRGRKLEVCRASKDSDEKICTVPVFCSQWIDWLELTEYFLSNPLEALQFKTGSDLVLTSVVHVTKKDPHSIMSPDQLGSAGPRRPDQPKTLEEIYQPTAYYKDQNTGDLIKMDKLFTWETIADANFPTTGMTTEQRQRQINKILANQPDQAVIVSDHRNYAFRAGYRVIIPNQGVFLPVLTSELKQWRWWYPVILGARSKEDLESHPDPKVIQQWYKSDGTLKDDAPPYAHRPIPIEFQKLLDDIQRGDKLREQLKHRYNAS